jgi:hypothetical protein
MNMETKLLKCYSYENKWLYLFRPNNKSTNEAKITHIHIFLRVSVTKTRVWIGESIYWIFTNCNCK